MKKLLTMTSAAALLVGLGMAPALANPTLKNSDGATDLVDITVGAAAAGRDIYIEAYNTAVISENELNGSVASIDLQVAALSVTGNASVGGQANAAGQFAQVVNTGFENVNQAANSVAAVGHVSFQ